MGFQRVHAAACRAATETRVLKVRDLLGAAPDVAKSGARLLAGAEDPDGEDGPTQEELNAMSREDLIMAFHGKKT